MRILWCSDAPWSCTGYGVQAKHLLPRLRALGHDVAIFAWHGLSGGMSEWDGFRVYPRYMSMYGEDVTGIHGRDWQADLIITLIDIWVYPPIFSDTLRPASWAPWYAVDTVPAAPQTVESARHADFPITYSRFGQAEMRAAGVETRYIPHGVETRQTFIPGDKRAARNALGWPHESFIASMVAANKGVPSRKAFPEQLMAFRQFRETHPDALLYLHTQRIVAPDRGIMLDPLLHALGLQDAVIWVDQYAQVKGIPESYMVQVYQASDVLLAATCSEGFGIPIVEAQACGTPVITTDFSSMPELTVNGIGVAPAQLQWSIVPADAWKAVPSVGGIANALTEIYDWSEEDRHEFSVMGRNAVVAGCDWDTVVQNGWEPFLREAEKAREEARAHAAGLLVKRDQIARVGIR